MPDKSQKEGGRGEIDRANTILHLDYSSDIILISDTQLLYQGYEQGITLTHFI